ncbi:type VII secretion protein EssB [Carnobacterium divergens]|uniref:type VII secretion protein EssB n=1 Tax=Carnobacterium divergens TaxID=2748 RepID=UPI000D40677E|nr:type VII secretion protein EssB [Carnobacterium divergens]MCO6018445.1 type VII secretion protein EssB [Carnobacterium divergens]TFI65230.1 type VII secretion protein EssB [Carnobacterium divergens]TFI92120.1 type VII secretion protein EssB [Carnobacterium divergens]TFJ07343.1 type VII secretion protein EssB [Carnobacterium divergens]TFJ08574.1 type VII secretion protein EssB [Carnobacterium divergens]
MSEVKDISEKIDIQIQKDKVLVTLQANQYRLSELDQFQHVLQKKNTLLAGEIIEKTEEQLILSYEKDPYAVTIEETVKKLTPVNRLLLAQKIRFIESFNQTTIQPFIHPSNIFLFGEELLIAHRGFMNSVVPHVTTEEGFLKQYRALILFILHPKLDYERLIEGAGTLQDPLSKSIQSALSIEEIDQKISEQVVIQKMKQDHLNKMVNKKSYSLFKWGSLVLFVATLILGFFVGDFALKKVPTQERIITAESNYIANDYAEVLNTLKEDTPETLPKSAQYVYAVSSIQLDNLSNEQKEMILNNVSQKSNENTLLYWIYIGKGSFEKALDIAQNVGDNQLILHAYTKLYEATKLDTKMNGEKKQELLTKYEEAIAKYMKLLGGTPDDSENE